MIDLKIHTNNPYINIACQRYWNRNEEDEFTEILPLLAKEYGMTVDDFTSFVNRYSSAYHKEVVCDSCGNRYQFKNREEYRSFSQLSNSPLLCDNCEEKDESDENDSEKLPSEADCYHSSSEFLETNFGNTEGVLISPDLMNFKQAVFLLTLIRHSSSEDYNIIYPIEEAEQPLSPTPSYTEDIITYLVSSGFISLHPATNPEAIQLQDGTLTHFNIEQVCWQLTLGSNTDQRNKIIHALEKTFRDKSWPESWFDQKYLLSREVLVQICLEYLDYLFSITLIDEPYKYFGKKTIQILNYGLNSLSVSNLFWLMEMAFSEISKRVRTERILFPNIISLFNQQLRSYIEELFDDDLIVEGIKRPLELPESTLSKVLYRSVFHITQVNADEYLGNN